MVNIPHNEVSVNDVLSSIGDEQTHQDALTLIEMLKRVTGHQPVIWNVGTIGFDSYHYKYESGREGDCQAIGFYPRKGKITIYLMDGTARYTEQLARLGKHSTSQVCLYLKRLNDIDLKVLEEIVKHSYQYVKSHDGQMQRAHQ